MAAIASLLIVLTMSLLVTRIAAMALMLTGMSREAARVQARSSFTGVGYTTREAKEIVGPSATAFNRRLDSRTLHGRNRKRSLLSQSTTFNKGNIAAWQPGNAWHGSESTESRGLPC